MKNYGTVMVHASASLALVLGATSCSEDPGPGRDMPGISAQALIADGTDVEAVRFDVTPVSCKDGSPLGASITETEPIDDDNTIPGNIAGLKDSPLDGDSKHRFADSFMVLAAGCYDVVATPVDGSGHESDDCAAAFKEGVLVEQAKTTEIFLINQCRGDDPGAIDTIAALNHEPTIDDVEFSDSKFSCGSPTRVCAFASDPDDDPLELVLKAKGCEVTPAASGKDGEQCWDITCHSLGKHNLSLTVYDLLHDANHEPQRIEDWLGEQGYPNESHSELAFWAYVDGFVLWPDKDGDGHGASDAQPKVFCEGDDTKGYVSNHDDCNDADAVSYPGATEIECDGVDQDCDGEDICKHCDAGRTCETYVFGECAHCQPGGVCAKTAEGGALCHVGIACAGLQECSQTSDCSEPGAVCLVDTCCGVPICVPPTHLEPDMCLDMSRAPLAADPGVPSTVR